MGALRDRERTGARRRLPDEVREAAVRAGISFAFTIVCLMVTVLASLAHSWAVLPSVLVSGAAVLTSTWCLLDIWIARQVAAQRHWGSGTTTAWANAAGVGRTPRRRAVFARRREAAPAESAPARRPHPGRQPHAA